MRALTDRRSAIVRRCNSRADNFRSARPLGLPSRARCYEMKETNQTSVNSSSLGSSWRLRWRTTSPLVARGEPSEALRKLLAHGRSVSAVDYLGALAKAQRYAAGLTDIFDAYDAIVTPAAPGVAPKGLGSTGDPALCSRPCRCRCSRARVPFRSGCNSSARPAMTAASCARRAR